LLVFGVTIRRVAEEIRVVPDSWVSTSDVRKTVTILFADLVSFSRLSLALDAEAVRNLLALYFGEQSAIVRRNRREIHR
jgi:class 3 adenylate cyclase